MRHGKIEVKVEKKPMAKPRERQHLDLGEMRRNHPGSRSSNVISMGKNPVTRRRVKKIHRKMLSNTVKRPSRKKAKHRSLALTMETYW